jgi:hypothetical protein
MPITVPQTAYSLEPAVAYAGMIADMSPRTVLSRLLETAAGAGAGLFLVDGTDPFTQCALPAATADVTNKLMGVSILQLMKAPTGSSPAYAQKDSVSIGRIGCYWCVVGPDGLTAGDPTLFVVHSGANAGQVQGTAGGDTKATAIPNGAAKCLMVSGTIALIQVNLP